MNLEGAGWPLRRETKDMDDLMMRTAAQVWNVYFGYLGT